MEHVPSTMRAAVLFGPGDRRVDRKPTPMPGPGEVLVRVAMCGTCGTDLKIQSHPFDIGKGDPLQLTVSIGVADFPEAKVETAEDLLDCADRALYRAKAGGRNLVCV